MYQTCKEALNDLSRFAGRQAGFYAEFQLSINDPRALVS
jgi:hypothetical protein